MSIFSIAVNYFKQVIKVTTMTQSNSLFPSGQSCGVTVPNTFVTNGFDTAVYDMVVFIKLENNQSQTYVAAAAPCTIVRWPVYGYTIFNAAHVSTNLS